MKLSTEQYDSVEIMSDKPQEHKETLENLDLEKESSNDHLYSINQVQSEIETPYDAFSKPKNLEVLDSAQESLGISSEGEPQVIVVEPYEIKAEQIPQRINVGIETGSSLPDAQLDKVSVAIEEQKSVEKSNLSIDSKLFSLKF